jgi:hypothetical protein
MSRTDDTNDFVKDDNRATDSPDSPINHTNGKSETVNVLLGLERTSSVTMKRVNRKRKLVDGRNLEQYPQKVSQHAQNQLYPTFSSSSSSCSSSSSNNNNLSASVTTTKFSEKQSSPQRREQNCSKKRQRTNNKIDPPKQTSFEKYLGPCHRGKTSDPKTLLMLKIAKNNRNFKHWDFGQTPNQFIVHIPEAVWEYILIPMLGLKGICSAIRSSLLFHDMWNYHIREKLVPLRVPADAPTLVRAKQIIKHMFNQRDSSLPAQQMYDSDSNGEDRVAVRTRIRRIRYSTC